MPSQPNQPSSDEADRSKETSPAGVEEDLEKKAEELGASADPPEQPTSGEDDAADEPA